MAQVAGQASAGTSQRRSLVAALAADTVVNLVGAFGLLGLTGLVREGLSGWEVAALLVYFVGNLATSAWLHRLGKALGRRDMRGLRFGRYGRQVLGRWAWVQAFSWLSMIVLLGVLAYGFARMF